jgi:uncharacterized protein
MYDDNDYNRYGGYEGTVKREDTIGTYTSKVFGWMFAGLLLTALMAFFIAGSDTVVYAIAGNPLILIGLVIAELVLVMVLSARIMKISYGAAISLFLLYSLLNGITLSIILLAYTLSSVAYAFAITSVTFGAMSIYGYITKTDLTRVGNILFMGLIGLIVLSVVNMFVHASSLEWIISLLGLFVFLGLTAYDTQKIKDYYYQTRGNLEMGRKIAVIGALRLYLDFINLFLIMLRFFGKRR